MVCCCFSRSPLDPPASSPWRIAAARRSLARKRHSLATRYMLFFASRHRFFAPLAPSRSLTSSLSIFFFFFFFFSPICLVPQHFEPNKINFYELYDVTKDYYMLHNAWDTAPILQKEQLHNTLQALVHCQGGKACSALLT